MQKAIAKRIEDADCGTVFITSDFADIASVPSINTALSLMAERNTLRRVMRGVYEKPRFSSLLGEAVAPNIERVADAIARNNGWTIAPAGNTALNLLWLSSQVPAVWEFVSDGPYKEYSCSVEDRSVKIEFRHSANNRISGLSRITATVIQAIKAVGKGISDTEIGTLRAALPEEDRQRILREAQMTTAWIYAVIKRISGETKR